MSKQPSSQPESRQCSAAKREVVDRAGAAGDVQQQIDLLQVEIEKANAAIAKAVRERREVAKDSPLVTDFNAAVTAARQALLTVEVRLRQLYESKEDA
jgi:hypothetical protein